MKVPALPRNLSSTRRPGPQDRPSSAAPAQTTRPSSSPRRMNQFKNVFLGLEKPRLQPGGHRPEMHAGQRQAQRPRRSAGRQPTPSSRCLGNFSFGDYFKREAWPTPGSSSPGSSAAQDRSTRPSISTTTKPSGSGPRRSACRGNGSSATARRTTSGMGDTGPCGPARSSTTTWARTSRRATPSPHRKGQRPFPRALNLVFMEFDQGPDGVLRPLPSPFFDRHGMGLERMTAVVRAASNFDTDLFLPLIERTCGMAGRNTRRRRGRRRGPRHR